MDTTLTLTSLSSVGFAMRRPSPARRVLGRLVVGALAFFTVAALADTARAVPSFARKYRTSCQTCHTQYPKLTPFGESFRLSGYQFPDRDREAQKGEPVELGSDKYKEVFPDAVWPSTILDSVPISVRAQGALAASLQHDAETAVDFRFPGSVAINAAGTLSDDIALWTGLHVSASGAVAADKVAFVFSNLFDTLGAPRHLLNLKVGQFEPEAQPLSSHRLTTLSPSRFAGFSLVRWADATVAGPAVVATEQAHLEAAKADAAHDAATPTAGGATGIVGGSSLYGLERGVELMGLITPRFLYAVGVFNGNGTGAPIGASFDPATGKDVLARLQLKLGGLALDGTGELDAKNWRETSVALGTTFRYGTARLAQTAADGTAREWDCETVRVGADVDIRVGDAQLTLAASWQHATDPGGVGKDAAAIAWSAELHLVWLAWLQSTFRYEGVVAGKGYSWAEQNAVANLAFLIRPNVKGTLEFLVDLKDPDNISEGAHALLIGLDGAF